MKKLKIIAIVFTMMFVHLLNVDAASFGMTSSKNQVSPNGTFTVKVGGECIGRVDLKVSNGSLSSSSIWVEQGYITVTVTAGASGNVTVTATPVTGFSDPDANLYNPGSRSVTVKIAEPTTTKPGTVTTTKKPNNNGTTLKKSQDNDLASLTVSEGTLSPAFDPEITEYTLNLPKDNKELTIKASTKDSKAKINGAGKVTLKFGQNVIEVVVTAENGSKKTYRIKAYVDESPDVFLDYLDGKIGIVKNAEGIPALEGFESKEHEIDGKKITIFTKDKLSLIYGLNGEERNYYLFDKEKNTIINLLTPVTIKDHILFVIDKKIEEDFLKKETVTRGSEKFACYKFEHGDANYCLLTAIDKEGNYKEYLYETTEETFQLYPKFLLDYSGDEKSKNYIILYVLGGLLGVSFIVIIVMVSNAKKGNKNEKNK